MPEASAKPSSRRRILLRNLIAGTTTAVVLIPQGMAYALVAGLPAYHGLYASVLPLIAYAVIGRSRQLAVGPGALDTVLIGAALTGMAVAGAEEQRAAWAMALALEVAIIQLLMATLRASYLVNFLSQPVLSGFTSGAAFLIGGGQLPALLGYEAERATNFPEILGAVLRAPDMHALTAVVGIGGIVVLMVCGRLSRKIPGPLVVVLAGILATIAFALFERGVGIVGEIPRGLPALALPFLFDPSTRLDAAGLLELLPSAFVVALIGYLTMISIARSFADRNGYEIDPGRELYAAAAANFAAGISQGFPVSASFSRSAVHDRAGATSPFTLLVCAAWVVLTLAFLTDALYYLPSAALAAIIIHSVSGLVDVAQARRLRNMGSPDFYLLLIAFIATLLLGVQQGILVGVGASLAFFIYHTSRPHTAVLGRVGRSRHFRNLKNYPEARPYPGMVILRFDAQLYFGNVAFFKDLIRRMAADETLQVVIIDGSTLTWIDSTADATLRLIADTLNERGVDLCFAALKMPVVRVLRSSGMYDRIGAERFFFDVDEAVRSCEKKLKARRRRRDPSPD